MVARIYVNRRIFKTRKEAFENVKLAVQSPLGFPPEGSYSGVKIGERCWSNRGKRGEREPYFRVLVFLKKNHLVTLFFQKYPEADPTLLERLALIVASRI